MGQLENPLNPAAVQKADDAFYANHKEMIDADGNRIPISATDPAQAGMRAEWRRLYLANGGKEQAPPAPTPPPAADPGIADPAAGDDATMGVCAAAVPCDTPCPEVEIQINRTPGTNDDLVQLRSVHPPYSSMVVCRIRGTSNPPYPASIVLTNPDGKLRFSGQNKTAALTVPNDGTWVSFFLYGEVGSQAIGDAMIEAHCHTATGALMGQKKVTVFWFDQPQINITRGAPYVLAGGQYSTGAPPGGPPAVNFSAQARIRPDGVDCSAPQVSKLKIGIVQTGLAGVYKRITWGDPKPLFYAGAPADARIEVPKQMRLTSNQPVDVNDTDLKDGPLYDRQPSALKPPIGCAGGGPAITSDSPANPVQSNYSLPAAADGVVVADVDYYVQSATVEGSWLTYVAVFDTVTQQVSVLRVRGWQVHADSSAAGPQAVTVDAADKDVTSNPPTGGPYANDVCNDPANDVTAPVNAADTVVFFNR